MQKDDMLHGNGRLYLACAFCLLITTYMVGDNYRMSQNSSYPIFQRCDEPEPCNCSLLECRQPEAVGTEMAPFHCDLKPENFMIEDRNGTLYFYYVMGEMGNTTGGED